MKKNSRSRLYCQALLLSAAFVASAHAQEVEVITVTASKRAENVLDVPMSITVLTGQAILENKDRNLHDLITRTPNLNFVTQGVNDVIYLRGFGSSPNNFAFDPDVSIYQDGIYGGRSGQFIQPIFDIQRVEVLRGPQGALVGKNTAAGAISIITADPQDKFEAMANIAYNFDLAGVDAQGYVTGPITDELSGRLAVKFIDQDGFLKNLAVNNRMEPHIDQKLVRGGLKYAPTSDFDATLKIEYGHFIQTGGSSTSGNINSPPPRRDTRFVEEPYGPTGLNEVNGVTSINGSFTVNYQTMDHTLTSITGYSAFHRYPLNGYDETNPNGGPTVPGINNLFQNGFPEHFKQFSQELRLLSAEGQTFEYVVGGYYDYADWDVTQNNFYRFAPPLNSGGQYTVFTQFAQTWSVFGIGTWNVTDDLRLIGSLRYTTVVKSGRFGGGTYFLTGTPFRNITSASGHLSEDSVDPSATIQYDITDDIMVYATYARGSKSGGFVSNTFGTTNATFVFNPETSTNYEIGAKGTLDEGRITFDIAAFNMNIEDLQVSAYVPALSTFITRNAASATSQGVELSVTWLPPMIDGLELSTSWAYLDAKYDQFSGAACLASEPVTVCNPTSPASIAAHNLADLVLQYSSMWTGNVRAKYTWQIPDSDLKLESTVVGSLRSKYINADNYHPIWGFQPTTVKWDARLQLGAQDDHWNVAIAGKNLFGIRTISNSLQFPGSVTTQARTISYMDPYRQIWIEGTLRF